MADSAQILDGSLNSIRGGRNKKLSFVVSLPLILVKKKKGKKKDDQFYIVMDYILQFMHISNLKVIFIQ